MSITDDTEPVGVLRGAKAREASYQSYIDGNVLPRKWDQREQDDEEEGSSSSFIGPEAL